VPRRLPVHTKGPRVALAVGVLAKAKQIAVPRAARILAWLRQAAAVLHHCYTVHEAVGSAVVAAAAAGIRATLLQQLAKPLDHGVQYWNFPERDAGLIPALAGGMDCE
jgi:hypothetical protein